MQYLHVYTRHLENLVIPTKIQIDEKVITLLLRFEANPNCTSVDVSHSVTRSMLQVLLGLRSGCVYILTRLPTPRHLESLINVI